MERLAIDAHSSYSPIEASIHLNRYLSAKNFSQGKNVLDIACGEGYGCALLEEWGANTVTGVDISELAISNATRLFGSDVTRFIRSSGEDICEVIGDQKFDLIVSFETIEHVNNPSAFLGNIKKLLSADGIILISCPNDNWYYRDGGANPYHLHKWDFWEFKRLSEQVLGAARWAYGTFSIGFATYLDDGGAIKVLSDHDSQAAMLSSQPIAHAILTHMCADSAPSPASVAYFLGIWGAEDLMPTYVGYPVSMDLTKYMQFKTAYVDEIKKAINEKDASLRDKDQMNAKLSGELEEAVKSNFHFRAQLELSESHLRDQITKSSALSDECIVLRGRVSDLVDTISGKDSEIENYKAHVLALDLELRQKYTFVEDARASLSKNNLLLNDMQQKYQELEVHAKKITNELCTLREALGQSEMRLHEELSLRALIENRLEQERQVNLDIQNYKQQLAERLSVLEREGRQQVLLGKIFNEENSLLKRQLGHTQWMLENSHKALDSATLQIGQKELELSQIPWRIVYIWTRLRRYLPLWLLRSMLTLSRIIRGSKR